MKILPRLNPTGAGLYRPVNLAAFIIVIGTVLLSAFPASAAEAKPVVSLDRFSETLPSPVINDRQMIERFAREFGAMVDAGEAKTSAELVEAFGASKDVRIAAELVAEPAIDGKPKSPSAIYRDHVDSVLMFSSVYKCGKCEHWHSGSAASAWVWGSKGILVTNYHLVGGDNNDRCAAVMTRDGRIFPVVELLAADEAADIAVVRVDLGEETLTPLALGPSPEIGDDVIVLSNPKKRLFSFTKGYVSRYFSRPAKRGGGLITQMTITADYAAGSSGGPILDEQGRVVGMVCSTVSARASKKGEDGKMKNGDVQMVFKDSVPVASIRALLKPE
jgi:serine protease Do